MRRRAPPRAPQGVFLAGWHDHDALPGFLNAGDVLALASVREQFGLVLVEGMACGLPAVAVDRFGPAEIVDDGAHGLARARPTTRARWRASLREALGDERERERRGERARAQAVGALGVARARGRRGRRARRGGRRGTRLRPRRESLSAQTI